MAFISKIVRKKGLVYKAEISLFDGSKKSRSFRTKEEALSWAHSEEDLKRRFRTEGISTKRIEFHSYAEKWFSEYAKFQHSPGWQISCKQMYNDYVRPHIGHKFVQEIQPSDILNILNSMRRKGLSATYANTVRVTLHKMFDDAVKTYRLISFNVVSATKPFKTDPFVATTLDQNEAIKLLEWADTQMLGIAFHLALQLGLREGEIVGLKWDAIDLAQRKLTVRRKWQKKVKTLDEFAKGKKIRSLGIYPDGLLNRLYLQREKSPTSEFVVSTETGSMVSPHQLIRLLQKGIRETGVTRVTLHGLRHTFASLYMQNGGDLYDLQKVMGHQSAATTERYRHTDPEYLKRKCNIFDLYSSHSLKVRGSAEIPPTNLGTRLRLIEN